MVPTLVIPAACSSARSPSSLTICTYSLIDPTRDIIIVNEGLHHNDPETTLPSNIDEFTAWYARDATSRACVLWRQTTPQHL